MRMLTAICFFCFTLACSGCFSEPLIRGSVSSENGTLSLDFQTKKVPHSTTPVDWPPNTMIAIDLMAERIFLVSSGGQYELSIGESKTSVNIVTLRIVGVSVGDTVVQILEMIRDLPAPQARGLSDSVAKLKDRLNTDGEYRLRAWTVEGEALRGILRLRNTQNIGKFKGVGRSGVFGRIRAFLI